MPDPVLEPLRSGKAVLRDITTDLRTVLSPALLVAGCVHVVDLATVRDRDGVAWDKIRDSVRARLENILRNSLTPADFFAPVDDTRYLVVTPQTNAEESAVICLRVLHELVMTLFGECGYEQLCIGRVFEDSNGEWRSEPFSKGMMTHLAVVAGIAPAPDASGAAAAQSDDDADESLPLVTQFEPIWDARHQAVTTYLCCVRQVRNGVYDPFGSRPLSVKTRTHMELAGLSAGVAELQRKLKADKPFRLTIPLSFETLGSPYGRMEIAGHCRNLPAACRRYLSFLITDVPEGVAHSRLANFVMTLGHFGHIVASVANGSRSISAYHGLRLWGIACDLGAPALDPERTAADIALMTAARRSMSVITLACNIESRATLSYAVAAGFEMIHGPCIGAELASPMGINRLPTTTLLAGHGTERRAFDDLPMRAQQR